jgi:hypothetical protein
LQNPRPSAAAGGSSGGPIRTALRPAIPRAGHAGALPPHQLARRDAGGRNVLRQLALLIGYIAAGVARAVRRHAFYARLAAAQTGSPSDSRLARADARRMNVGWVLVWRASPEVLYYLRQTGSASIAGPAGSRVYRPDGIRRGAP